MRNASMRNDGSLMIGIGNCVKLSSWWCAPLHSHWQTGAWSGARAPGGDTKLHCNGRLLTPAPASTLLYQLVSYLGCKANTATFSPKRPVFKSTFQQIFLRDQYLITILINRILLTKFYISFLEFLNFIYLII